MHTQPSARTAPFTLVSAYFRTYVALCLQKKRQEATCLCCGLPYRPVACAAKGGGESKMVQHQQELRAAGANE